MLDKVRAALTSVPEGFTLHPKLKPVLAKRAAMAEGKDPMDWGTAEQIQNPDYSAKSFYQGLTKVNGWQDMPLTKAAQKVQVSAYPDHYAKHETQAGDMIAALYGSGPYTQIAAAL